MMMINCYYYYYLLLLFIIIIIYYYYVFCGHAWSSQTRRASRASLQNSACGFQIDQIDPSHLSGREATDYQRIHRIGIWSWSRRFQELSPFFHLFRQEQCQQAKSFRDPSCGNATGLQQRGGDLQGRKLPCHRGTRQWVAMGGNGWAVHDSFAKEQPKTDETCEYNWNRNWIHVIFLENIADSAIFGSFPQAPDSYTTSGLKRVAKRALRLVQFVKARW